MTNVLRALVIVVGSLLVACFSATKPLDSTQTGNPPVIDAKRVALYVTSSEVRVIGEPGAVEPGGAKVEVKNITTGKTVTVVAAADGSFDVKVTGSESDSYSVRAKAAGMTSNSVFVIRGTAAVGGEQEDTLTCEQRNIMAGELLAGAAANADRSCNVDADCKPVLARASCYASDCRYAYVSERGEREIEHVASDVDASLCAGYAADGCDLPLAKCLEPLPPVCSMGRCDSSQPADPDGFAQSCNGLAMEAGARLDAAIRTADRSCNKIDDCIVWGTRASCRDDCTLAGEAFSQRGIETIAAALEQANTQECAKFESLGCRAPEPSCDDSTSELVVACINNVCLRGTNAADRSPLPGCGKCLPYSVQWETQQTGGGVDVRTVESCERYQRHWFDGMTGDEVTCTGDLFPCNALASTGVILKAVGDPDVQRVLAYPENPVRLGNTRVGDVFRITIEMRQLELGGSCEGAPPDCAPVPPGVEALRTLLQEIDDVYSIPMGPCAAIKD